MDQALNWDCKGFLCKWTSLIWVKYFLANPNNACKCLGNLAVGFPTDWSLLALACTNCFINFQGFCNLVVKPVNLSHGGSIYNLDIRQLHKSRLFIFQEPGWQRSSACGIRISFTPFHGSTLTAVWSLQDMDLGDSHFVLANTLELQFQIFHEPQTFCSKCLVIVFKMSTIYKPNINAPPKCF